MKRALWIIAILLGLGAICAVVCRKMCGECCCHESEEKDVEEKQPENEDSEEEQEGEGEGTQEEEKVN